MTRSFARFFAALLFVGIGIAPALAVQTPYIVVDADSGKVLAERNSFQYWYAASITKLMNAYVVFSQMRAGKLTMNTPVIVSRHALDEAPSKMGFQVGTEITLDNALKMMLVHSANDIAMAVGETAGGTEDNFVAMMNAQAARLGMVESHFVNPNGLPQAGQRTTARDLAVLATALWHDFPEHRALFGIPAIRYGDRVMRSENTLLERYHGTMGMKTGFICSSGFNIVVMAQRNGHTLAAVVLGAQNSKTRAELTARLLNQSFGSLALSGLKPSLQNFRGASPVPEPVDMRQDICLGRHHSEDEADGAGNPTVLATALDPKFELMPPVDVNVAAIPGPNGMLLTSFAPADAYPPAPPKKVKPVRAAKGKLKAKKHTAIAKSDDAKSDDAKTDNAKADAKTDDAEAAPAKAAKPKAPAALKKPAKKKPGIEIGVPFDSSEIAPSPGAPVAQ